MIDRLRDFTRVLLAVLLLSTAGAAAQTAQKSTSPDEVNAAQAGSAAGTPAAAPASTAAPHIDKAGIAARVKREVGVDVEAAIAGWQRALERVEGNLRGPRLRYSELNGLRDELQRVRSEIEDFANRVEAPLSAAKAQLDLLGMAPAAGQPPEADTVARNRAELNYHVGLLSAGQSAVNSSNLRVDQLIDTIQDIRRKNFTNNLFQPVPGIYAHQTWARLPDFAPIATSRLHALMLGWWDSVPNQDEIARIGLEAVLIWLVLTGAAWYGVRRLRQWPHAGEPPFWRRASSAAGVVALRIVPVVAPIVFLYAMIADAHAFPERLDRLFYAAAQSTIIIVALAALVTSVFTPASSHWRLVAASDRAAARVCGLVITLALVYGVTTLIYAATRIAQAPFALTVAVAFPSSLLLAGIVAAILLTPLQAEHRDGMPSLRWVMALRIPLWVAIAGIVASALGGYLALSRFLAQQLIVTGSILALVYLLLLWVDGFIQSLADNNAAIGRWLEHKAGLSGQRREQLGLPIGLLLKSAVLVLSVPLILLQWGYSWPDIYEWYRQLFFGFHIGNTQVSFAVVLASVIVFGIAYAAARLFQSWLDTRVLKRAGISGGVRDSIRIGVGYVGIVIAALAAFSYAGFNLSNLAIVAGAFSVGIGFGLQSVVNNFVSGLILLAERPIKVGDLVVVGGEEGYVRKISVRSTEVETSERARVIVPNSYLITEKVKNWTLRDNLRRIVIPVPVAHGCDPRKVKAVLLKVAQDNPKVVSAPAPSVELDDFSADSLQFKLYAFIDLNTGGGASTDLRIAILEAFGAAGIATPWGQASAATRDAASQRGSGFGNGNGFANGTPHSLQIAERQDGSSSGSIAPHRVRTSLAG
jgi:potassium-dependent mechanosensitive channel